MGYTKINLVTLAGVFAAVAVALYGLEMIGGGSGGSLLFSMLFFVMFAQGPLAVIAATDIVESDWAKPFKREMLAGHHLSLFIAMLFAAFYFASDLDFYNWTRLDHPIAWLNKEFFFARNVAVLLVTWLVGCKFANESINNTAGRTKWGLFYVFSFVICQTVIAFDWIMSLDYPWISTLFGIYFFVATFYSSLGLAAVWTLIYRRNYREKTETSRYKKSRMDMMTLFFGFSVFWAYQFFSQFIVIWYGNIAEEVAYIDNRMQDYGYFIFLPIIMLFFIPFVTLLFRKFKANPNVASLVALSVWGGVALERFYMVNSFANVSVLAIAEMAAIGAVFAWVFRNRGETNMVDV